MASSERGPVADLGCILPTTSSWGIVCDTQFVTQSLCKIVGYIIYDYGRLRKRGHCRFTCHSHVWCIRLSNYVSRTTCHELYVTNYMSRTSHDKNTSSIRNEPLYDVSNYQTICHELRVTDYRSRTICHELVMNTSWISNGPLSCMNYQIMCHEPRVTNYMSRTSHDKNTY